MRGRSVTVYESQETLVAIQRLIAKSADSAGPAIRKNFSSTEWAMSAEEFVGFWGEERMASISTVSSEGLVHVVPLGLRLMDGKFYVPTFPDSQRLKDHRANPRCAISSWEDHYPAVIVYGLAQESDVDPTGRPVARRQEGALRQAQAERRRGAG